MKIALIRLDKIGDLVSTLPVDEILEGLGHEVHWIIANGLEFLPENSSPKRVFHSIPIQSFKTGYAPLKKILADIEPDLSVLFYGPWWASYATLTSGIPKRFGRRSQWHSLLFLTDSIRQSRSASEKHEADYNFELLISAMKSVKSSFTPPSLEQTPVLKLEPPPLRHLFEKFHISPKQYIIVHAGMAGSALNWPQKNYIELISSLAHKHTVLLTGTKTDASIVEPIFEATKANPRVQLLLDKLNATELLFILKSASYLVVPSTGVAHLGASLTDGPKVISLFPPLKSQHPNRWAPRGAHAQVLFPNLECPAKINCLAEKCEHHPCMPTISVKQVLELMIHFGIS